MTWTWGHVATRALAVAGLAAAAIGLTGTPVSARVTVDPARAESGGYTTLTFSVANERTDASTTAVEIRFPEDHPVPGLMTEPKPGWDVTVEKVGTTTSSGADGEADEADESTEEAVAGVRWTASGSGVAIDPGTFELFRVSVGPLPSGVDVLVLEARQTYSDGEIIDWDGRGDGSDDSADARPAPTLTLTLTLTGEGATDLAAASSSATGTAGTPATAAEALPEGTTLTAEEVSAADDDDRSARVALGLAAGGVLIFGAVAATSFARRRGGDAPSLPGV